MNGLICSQCKHTASCFLILLKIYGAELKSIEVKQKKNENCLFTKILHFEENECF